MAGESVFLCHSSKDKTIVEPVALALLEHDIDPWYDDWRLAGGSYFDDKVLEGIKAASVVVVFVGNSGTGPWQKDEIAYALNKHKRTIPVLLKGVEEPPGFLANRHAIRLESAGDREGLRRLVLAIRGEAPGPPLDRVSTAALRTESPYRPLRVFDVSDRPRFFGRKQDIERALSKLAGIPAKQSRFIVIVGGSGSGKSSLARAGILSSLHLGSPSFSPLVFTPGRDPLGALAQELGKRRTAESDVHALVVALRADTMTLSRELDSHPGPSAVLVDQLEELITQTASDPDRKALLANILNATFGPRGHVAVLTLQDRFLGDIVAAGLTGLDDNQIIPRALGPDDYRAIIGEPAAMAGRPLDPALVDSLAAEAGRQANPLPVLQVVLDRIWKRTAHGANLSHDPAPARGLLEGAIEDWAEEVYSGLSKDPQFLFVNLIKSIGDGRSVRRTLAMSEFVGPKDQEGATLLQDLAAGRLISLTYSVKTGVRIELSHEALIQHWKRLGGWVKEYEELIVWKDRLQVRIDDGLLLKGQALAKAKTYRKNLRQALTKSELAFIRNSEIRQWIHHTLWIGGVAAAVFMYVAVDRRMDCKNIADAATAATGRQKSIGLLFADYYGQHCGAERGYSLLQAAVLATSLPAIQTQPAGRETMEFNDSGTTLATVEAGRGVKLWDSPGGQFKESRFQELQAPMAIAFAGGQLAAAGVRNAAIEIVRPGQPALQRTLTPGAKFFTLAPSTGGLAVSSDTGGLQWWPDAGNAQPVELGPLNGVQAIASSPDGKSIAAAAGNSVSVWRAGGTPGKYPHTDGQVIEVRFLTDGRIFSFTEGGQAYLWRIGAERPDRKFGPAGVNIRAASIDPEEKRVLTANLDKSLSLWDAATGQLLWSAPLPDSDPLVSRVLLAPGAKVAAVADADGAIRLLRVDPELLAAQVKYLLAGFCPNVLQGCAAVLGERRCRPYVEAAHCSHK